MIIVTGGTGLLGSHLLVELTQKHQKVICLYRSDEKKAQVEKVFAYYNRQHDFYKIEFIKADLLDYLELENLINKGDFVYNCAAIISFDPRDAEEMIHNNVSLTRNIVNVCLEKKVEALCHVSSVAALGNAKNQNDFITESTIWNPKDINSSYGLSKYLSENEVWRGTEEGLNAIIVNPSVIIGEGFWKTGSGNLFTSALKTKNKFYTTGITGYVDVKDVVRCMTDLMGKQLYGQRFIISSENKSYKEIFTLINNSLQIPPPTINANRSMLNIAWRLNRFYSVLTNQKSFFTKETANAALQISLYSNQKIKEVLGYNFNSIEKTIERVGKQFRHECVANL